MPLLIFSLFREKPLLLQVPDFIDIRELIEKTNTKCNLGLSTGEVDREAREVFVEVGRKLQVGTNWFEW